MMNVGDEKVGAFTEGGLWKLGQCIFYLPRVVGFGCYFFIFGDRSVSKILSLLKQVLA